MKVKIIDGVYGFRDESGAIQPVTPRDDAIDLPEEEAQRLVALKVAQLTEAFENFSQVAHNALKTGDTVQAKENTDNDEKAKTESTGDSKDEDAGQQEKPSYSEEMTAAELKDIMEKYGVTVKARMTKGDMVTALNLFFAEEDGVDDGEAPPDLGGDDIVS